MSLLIHLLVLHLIGRSQTRSQHLHSAESCGGPLALQWGCHTYITADKHGMHLTLPSLQPAAVAVLLKLTDKKVRQAGRQILPVITAASASVAALDLQPSRGKVATSGWEGSSTLFFSTPAR